MIAEDLAPFRNLLAGCARDAQGGEWPDSRAPAHGETWASIPHCSSTDVDAAVNSACTAFRSPEWREARGEDEHLHTRSVWINLGTSVANPFLIR